jgi:hypothetical protein
MFATWFASGIVMIYVPFPSLSDAERIKRAEVVDVSGIRSLSESFVAAGIDLANRIRFLQYQKRPILIVEDNSNSAVAVFADSSELVLPLTAADASNIAKNFSNTSIKSVSGAFFYDQWVVHDRFDQYRPFFRVALEDEAQTHLYVSAKTTEVLQRTNRHQRAWNYVGAVVHWIYPTFIRKNWALWDQLVWWVSLIGIVGVVAGLVLGIQHFLTSRRRGTTGLASPFAGWLAWHHRMGFLFGIVVLLWAFSGWLSMDHGRLFSVPDPILQQVADVRGITLSEAFDQIRIEDVVRFASAKELEITAFNEEAFLVARNNEATELMSISSGRIADQSYLMSAAESAVSRAWPESGMSDRYLVPTDDVYGNLREGSLHENTFRLVLDDANRTWIHIDLNDGRLISVIDDSRRMYRWLFNGIHSLDLPGLVNRRPLWDILIILLMTIGFIFCITGVVLAYKRVIKATES